MENSEVYLQEGHVRMAEAAAELSRSTPNLTPKEAMELLNMAWISVDLHPLEPLQEARLAPLLDWTLAFALGVTASIFFMTMWPSIDPLLWMLGSWVLVALVFSQRALVWWREWKDDRDG